MSVDRKIFPNCTTINVDKPCAIKIYYSGHVTVTQTNIYEEDTMEAYQKHNPKLPQDNDKDESLLKAFFKLNPVGVNDYVGLKRPEAYKQQKEVDDDEEFVKIYSGRRTTPKAGETKYAAKKDEDLGNSFVKMERPAGHGVIPESGNAVLEEYYLSEANDLGKNPATPIVPLALDSFASTPCVDVKDYMNDLMADDMMKKFEKPAKKQTSEQQIVDQQSFKDYVKSLQTFNRKTLSEITKRYFKTFDKLEKISNEMQHEYHTPGHFEELFATHLTLGYEIAVLKNIMQKIKSVMDAGSNDYSDVINYIKSITN